jgi:chemosensory pili system protein ChpA (sensor histidine kinase/response regulator)
MTMKIETNLPLVAYHIVNGPTQFQYAVDAQQAVGGHPNEWKFTPWTQEEVEASRGQLADQGVELPEPEELSPEDQEALDQHTAAVAEANERLAAYRAKKEQERQEAEQVARDEAIAASAPPPRVGKRPFGRPGEPTAAEKAMMEKQAADKAEKDRLAKEEADKAEADRKEAERVEAERKANEDRLAKQKAALDAGNGVPLSK